MPSSIKKLKGRKNFVGSHKVQIDFSHLLSSIFFPPKQCGKSWVQALIFIAFSKKKLSIDTEENVIQKFDLQLTKDSRSLFSKK